MLFKHYLMEDVDISNIKLDNQNQVIILAGGAASGKSYVINELKTKKNKKGETILPVDTKVFSLDDIKEKYIKGAIDKIVDKENEIDYNMYNTKYKDFCTYIYKKLHHQKVEDYTFNGKTVNFYKMPEDILDKIKYDKKYKDETKVIKELKQVDLSNEIDTALLHSFVSIMGLPEKEEQALFKPFSELPLKNKKTITKPNIVFDTTLSSKRKLSHLSEIVKEQGYNVNDIHIIWIVQDLEKALYINDKRTRKVPEYIVTDTYRYSKITMSQIIKNIDYTIENDIMNGNIWLIYNDFDTETKCIQIKKQGSNEINNDYEKILKTLKNSKNEH